MMASSIPIHKRMLPAVVIGNTIFITLLIFSLINLVNNFELDIGEQNRNDIENIAVSSATNYENFFSTKQTALINIANYIEKKEFDINESLEFIANVNEKTDIEYQIIDSTYNGFSTKKTNSDEYTMVSYVHDDYDNLYNIFRNAGEIEQNGAISFTPEFSNATNSTKSVAEYTYVGIKDSLSETKFYTLFQISTVKSIDSATEILSQYDNLSSALINISGNYILTNGSFKSDNYFDYLQEFFGLSLDETQSIKNQIIKNENGSFSLRNNNNALETHFSYSYNSKQQWCAIVSVPTSSFVTSENHFLRTVESIICAFLLLLFDLCCFMILYQSLKKSMLSEAEASRAKTDFLSRISHDMRTPMNGIIGMSSFIDEATTLEEAKDYNRNIKESSDYLLLLINDTIDINRIEIGSMTLRLDTVACETFIANIIDEVAFIAFEKEIDIDCNYDCLKKQEIIVDKLRFKQVLMNILTNAIKYTNNGGHIYFTVQNLSNENGKTVDRYIIRDTGIGMSKEFMKKMYSPFEQESNSSNNNASHSGSGLGLSIVEKLVRLMNGKISCESEIGKGTTFTIDITYERKEYTKKIVNDSILDYNILKGKRVLLAEDNEINKKIIVKILEDKGVNVTWAQNGQIALDFFINSTVGYFDYILMDIRMPIMDGLAATRSIRKLKRIDAQNIRIIALTADALHDDMKRSFEAGMDYHLSKPVAKEDLYKILLE